MIISKFEAKECPQVRSIIKQLILNRQIRSISGRTVKPQPLALARIQSQQSSYRQFTEVRYPVVKQEVVAIIKRKHSLKNLKSQLKAQEKYKQWLLNYLHKSSNLQLIRGMHPISMLGTIDQPVYPGNYEQGSYRKDFPHHSNIIQPIDIHRQASKKTVFFRALRRPANPQQLGSTFENTCVTIATVIRFVFKFLKSRAQHFEQIAEELLESVRNVKLLFDVLSCAFKLQKQNEKLQRFRLREKMFREQYLTICKIYRDRIERLFQNKQSPSTFIPREQIWISLKELHDLIIEFEY